MNDNLIPQLHKIPLTLGITGHRDLREEDKEFLRNSVRKLFQFLRQHYPNTPLQLLSPLADGADRLVAQLALEENVQLLVPLPMSQDLYEIDFQTPDSKAEFLELLDKAHQVFELSLLEGNTRETIRDYGEARSKQYALAGAYIARHCHILIALWDGLPLDKAAGTSQVVQFKLTGDMEELPDKYKPQHGPLDVPDTGPVCQVITGRESGKPLNTSGEIRIRLPNNKPGNHLTDLLSSDLKALNCFNQDVEKYANHPKRQRSIQKGQKYLLSDKLWQHLHDLSPAFQTMLGVYSTANTLARYFQSGFRQSTMAVLRIAAVMVILYGCYTSIEANLAILIGYLILFLGAAGILWIAKWQRYHSKSLDYRALAEGMRVQIFWHLGGLPDSVADHYLRKQRGELTWIRSAILALNVYDWVETLESLDNVHLHWIENQREWFLKSAKKNQHQAKKLGLWVKGLFALGMIFIVAMLVGHFSGILQPGSLWHNLLILGIALAPAAAALLHHYAEKMAFDEQAKQYERMTALFSKASEELEKILIRQQQQSNESAMSETDQKAAKTILLELGKEALEENGDWVLLHRKRPLELPQNG
jgi:nitrate reductase gamma subunit